MEYAVGAVEMWADHKDIKSTFFADSKIDSEVILELLDVPAVHSYQEKLGEEFF